MDVEKKERAGRVLPVLFSLHPLAALCPPALWLRCIAGSTLRFDMPHMPST